MSTLSRRISASITKSLPTSAKTVWWLLKLIVPISFIVSLLQYWGIISQFASLLAPVFSLIGLPGESAVVFISSIFLPLYGPIAIISTLSLTIREITILALMCLVSHNLIVETAIQKKTGSPAAIMFLLRIITSIAGAYILNLLLPENLGSSIVASKNIIEPDILSALTNWLWSTLGLVIKITLIVTGLMILQNILKEFNVLSIISKVFAPFMKIMGLSNDSSFLWFVAQTLGLTYGSAVMLEEVEHNGITPGHAQLLNYHIAVNHSLLEDTLLFVAIGVPAIWIIVPRFIFAIGIVWTVRIIQKLRSDKKTILITQINK